MKQDKKIIVSIAWVIIGVGLISLSFAGIVDEYWSGMGSGLLVVGILQLIRQFRFRKNPEYREKIEIEISDERNSFLRNKAWAWAGYLFVVITALSAIVLKILEQDILSQAASIAVCLMLVLFWGSYHILKRKY